MRIWNILNFYSLYHMCKLEVYYCKREVCIIQNITTSGSIWLLLLLLLVFSPKASYGTLIFLCELQGTCNGLVFLTVNTCKTKYIMQWPYPWGSLTHKCMLPQLPAKWSCIDTSRTNINANLKSGYIVVSVHCLTSFSVSRSIACCTLGRV
jgi:hypothetical protein